MIPSRVDKEHGSTLGAKRVRRLIRERQNDIKGTHKLCRQRGIQRFTTIPETPWD